MAAWLSERIGLINTMVFTHIPSSLCLIAAAFSLRSRWSLALLLVRSALSQMDVPTRSSYVMAVVTPAERTAAASVTAVPRSLASAISPAIAGVMLAGPFSALPLVACGVPENRLRPRAAGDVPPHQAAGGNVMHTGHELILLSGRDLEALLKPRAVIEALQQAYRDLAANRADSGKSLAFTIDGGSAHVKAGLLPGSRAALAAKINVNLPGNFEKRQLPTIQGALLLADTITGRPLALMDLMTLTAIRTAATAMFAARWRAQGFKIAAIIGCGMQGRYQAEALKAAFPVREIRVFDQDKARARAFASAIGRSRHPGARRTDHR